MRLSQSQISEINKMTKDGKSLNQISRNLGIGKTTAYYYFRKIRGKTFSSPIIRFENDRDLGEVIGVFTGDGSQSFDPINYHYQNRVHFGVHNKNYAIYVKTLYEKCFGKKFFVSRDGNTKLIVATNSKDIFNWFFERAIRYGWHYSQD